MKKIISLLLSLSLLAGLLALPVSAASTTEAEMITAVQALGIMMGDENGDMKLTNSVTRAEFATMAVRATPGSSVASSVASAPFPDVATSHWSASYVTSAVKYGYLNGYTDGTFKPDNQITLAEGLAVVLRVLGYDTTSLDGNYPDGYITLADQLDLLDDLSSTDPYTVLTRSDAMTIFYNALTATTATGTTFLNSLGYSLTSAGEVDLTALVNGAMEGPVVATGDWTAKVDVDLDTATILKDGKTISASQISDYDVVYWSDNMRTLWVYSDRVTGTIQMISPSTTSPTAVMVAAQTYTLGSSAAIYALSQQGSYSVGDSVTLLLGRDGSVVSVTDPSATSVDRVGMITAIQKSSYDSGSYTADSITILATDGNTYSYPVSTSYFSVGDLARVSTLADGSISVTRATDVGLSGTVSTDGTALGKVDFASNVQILEIYKTTKTGAVVYPSRLAGVELSKDDILYSETNDDGEISLLILNDVTGDLHGYALITDITVADYGTSLTSYYYVTIGETETALVISGARYTTSNGPAVVTGGFSDIQNIQPLSSVTLTHTSGTIAYDGTTAYPMADDVQVYEKSGSDYYLTTLDRALQADLTLTAYYDDVASGGGRVRIIIAQ